MTEGHGAADRALSEIEISKIVRDSIPPALFAGRKVLVLTPDTTRTCPLPLMIRCLGQLMAKEAARLDFMVALGTHTPLTEPQIFTLYGISEQERREGWPDSRFLNHRWELPDTLARIGWLEKEEIEELSGGRLSERVPVDINRAIFDYDQILILGPVFPHEVVGYSGGAKYLFPGISGGEFLHAFHWLGAVVTCPGTIGIKDTPVREVINRAMRFVQTPVRCLAMVVKSATELYGLYGGDWRDAWSLAADLSEQVHVVVKEKPYHTVFGICPPMYERDLGPAARSCINSNRWSPTAAGSLCTPRILPIYRGLGAPTWNGSATMSVIIFLADPDRCAEFARGARPLHPRPGPRHHGRRDRKTADRGDAGLGHPAGNLPQDQSRLPRSGHPRSGRVPQPGGRRHPPGRESG